MNHSTQLAKHLRDVYFGGNWTASNLNDQLKDISWKEATTRVDSLNTIALLVYHMGYYIEVVIKVLQGGPLEAKDIYSFDLPPIRSEKDWKVLVEKQFSQIETLAGLIEQLPEEQLWKTFEQEKYGNYYRNLFGIIEHCHYHLGQIALIKKLLRKSTK